MGAKLQVTFWLMALGCMAVANAQDMRIQFAEPVTLDAKPGPVQFDAYGRRFEVALESNDRLLKALPAVRKA